MKKAFFGVLAAAAAAALAVPQLAWADAVIDPEEVFVYEVLPLVAFIAVIAVAVGVLVYVVRRIRKR